MKKILIVVSLAVITGAILAVYVFKGIDKSYASTINNNEVVIFQVGVYKNYENAIISSNNYPWSTIIYDGNYYRVYIGIAKNKKVIKSYSEYFDSKNINYYTKKVDVPKECIAFINKYENLVIKSLNPETYNNINKELLKYYKDECND